MRELPQNILKYEAHNIVLINRKFMDLNPLFLGFEFCRPEKSFGPAVRNYTLIHYVAKGRGRVFKNNIWHEVSAGKAFVILPGEVVTYVADREEPWYYQWIAFDGALSARFSELETVIDFPEGLVQEMLETEENNMREYRVASLLFRLYAELFESRVQHNHYVRRVEDHIHALYMQEMTVEGIANAINLNRRYLSRIFKEKTGKTIQEYLIEVRMEEAKKCLLRGFSVEESAKLCGYEDTCNFSKMFKRLEGISPLHWKQRRGS